MASNKNPLPLNVSDLARILAAELEDGCRDRLVVGGLGQLIENLAGRFETRALGPLAGYGQLSPDRRRAALTAALGDLPTTGSRPRTSASTQSPRAGRTKIGLGNPVATLPRLSSKQLDELAARGINTCSDLLQALPREHQNRTQYEAIALLPADGAVQIRGDVVKITRARPRPGLSVTNATLTDGSGRVQATWFNQHYLADTLRDRTGVAFYGQMRGGKLNNPEYELHPSGSLNAGRITPIYSQIPGISQKQRRSWVARIIADALPGLPEPLPPKLLAATDMPGRAQALEHIHFPPDPAALARAEARLAFDEIFYYHLEAQIRRQRWRRQSTSDPILGGSENVRRFIAALPFELTGDQQQAIAQILGDLERPYAMHRLLQGDVGSGKTVVAAAALLAAVSSGCQAAIMAPTQILAGQHLTTLGELLGNFGVRLALVTAALGPAERKRLWQAVQDGLFDVVVGTHALVSESAGFANLNLVIVDEQHRFGVRQRASLRGKGGGSPHTLIMTATPIPRTMAGALFGDVEVSQIVEMPAGRDPITTILAKPDQRSRAYQTLLAEVAAGAQAYIVCPLIEASQAVPARAAEDEFERLRAGPLRSIAGRIGLLHGQLPADTKSARMQEFATGQILVLVTTSVVEVGVDVSNASVMMIEGAERFGLAQLHQLRGRVGRGRRQSLCLLLSDSASAQENERLAAMGNTASGFELAEIDLKLRGAGELLGTRQSGFDPAVIRMLAHPELSSRARRWAKEIGSADPNLAGKEQAYLRRIIQRRLRQRH